ncbi:Diphosphomevalonate decarboxylase [Meloidogyne graminicola]|uniref:Diphosphomevalonate decarboxylase n=1 Tax=Meloidogyne graminicola TaxID=189291 RepID=A0A8T0A411_9BILA|nr:Diphosphomevalonate decarboxylase [Meloidogyne graminicola]
MSTCSTITVKVPINIALIKYWGKQNKDLIIPLNDSISLTINSLCAITKITVDSNLKNDLVLINGQTINNPRFELVFNEIRKIIGTRKRNLNGELLNDYFKVESTTNFPVAAGLASSAAGFAAISFGFCSLFKIKNQKEIIRLARIGSGSACRSILGGFVHWKAGNNNEDDSECTCEQIKQISHWEELRVLVIIQSEESKKIGSTEAMQRSVLTSKLLKTRIEECVPKRIENLKEAILTKNFSKLAEITMAESNQLHAICLDTFPPIIYLNSISYSLMEFVHDFNYFYSKQLIAYTFDAGPNCFLIFEESTFPLFYKQFKKCFNYKEDLLINYDENECKEIKLAISSFKEENEKNEENICNTKKLKFPWLEKRTINIKQLVLSKLGDEPKILEEN